MKNKSANYLHSSGFFGETIYLYCTNCLDKVTESDARRNNYCPICGAKIKYKEYSPGGGGASSGYGMDLSFLDKISEKYKPFY